jgi:tRNA (adenine37-N6)-methyltransferase
MVLMALNGTPLLDIKPSISGFDSVEESSSEWLKASDEEIAEKRPDDRFE